jgi:SAM-dependent methyltransferase
MVVVERHRTAMSRTFLSRPVMQALDDGLITTSGSVFDYGCGRGNDIRLINQMGIRATGWDPAFAPKASRQSANVVNLGYVVNVIEDPAERAAALREAWQLTTEILIVSARLALEAQTIVGQPHGDGLVTSSRTFQKFFTQEQLRSWIDSTLGTRCVAGAPGIFYVFREAQAQQRLLARQARGAATFRQGVAEILYQKHEELLLPLETWVKEHGRLPSPADIPYAHRIVEELGSLRTAFSIVVRATGQDRWSGVRLPPSRRSEERFERNLGLLQPLIDFLMDRGRLPRSGELSVEAELCAGFGSVRAAFSLVRRVTGPDRWAEYESKAKDSFLVYLALAAFGGRPKFSDLPEDFQYDAKDLFGSYREAQTQADDLLFASGNLDIVRQACGHASIGKRTPEALYVHRIGLTQLPPILRVYEGCARTLTGAVPDATIIKLHQQKPQVSYLIYPDFDRDPHPALKGSVISRLARLHVDYRNFAGSENPPVLHRKETFVPPDYQGRANFERLTRQEERRGLLDQPNIGTRHGWEQALATAGVQTRGHRLVKR